jgi:N-acetylglucosamine-6-phosphate deacetylase
MRNRSITGLDPLTGQPLRIVLEGDHIASVGSGPTGESAWLSPGFVDLQVNGYCGRDLNDESVDADTVIELAKKLAATGVTTFLPTLISAPEKKIVHALSAVAQARRTSALAARTIPFVHLEGPFISPEDGARGAHPLDAIRPPSLAEFERWQSASGNLVGMVTLSPHWPNALEFTAALAGKGILVSIGHTHATSECIHAAAAAGATLSTHLGNGIKGILRRHPNPIWAQLADDRLAATFIADGHHLDGDALKSMLRAKSIERSILVSDATALAGMPPGTYRSTIGGDVELRADGRLAVAGTAMLAGSASPLKDGIAHAVSSGVCTLAEAIRMSTENPGRLLGGVGAIRPGAKANLVRFALDSEQGRLQIKTVLVEGDEFE